LCREGGDALLGERALARARPARHHRELDSTRAHRQRADPPQLQPGTAGKGRAGGDSARRIRQARGCREPGLLPGLAPRALYHRNGHSRRRRHEEIPVLRFLILWALAFPVVFPCCAQDYPSKPIRLVVPFAPGGSSTLVARVVSEEMSKGLGQSFVIENKGGGGGNPAMLDVARADPDGYTLLVTHIGSLALNPFLYSSLPFDVNRDFVHVTLLAKVPNIFVVHESVPARDLREFVALARREPGKLYYGSAGNGSAGHLAMEYLKLMAGI